MSIAEEVAAGVANALGPIVENAIATIIREEKKMLSGKVIKLEITLPDFEDGK